MPSIKLKALINIIIYKVGNKNFIYLLENKNIKII